jgi:putative transposase
MGHPHFRCAPPAQKRFYDFNVWSERKRIEKLRYMHRNPGPPASPVFGLLGWKPVQRGLVASPELWRWSSFRAYFFGEPGAVRVNAWEVLKMKLRPPAA